jgi:hypothetical protein
MELDAAGGQGLAASSFAFGGGGFLVPCVVVFELVVMITLVVAVSV